MNDKRQVEEKQFVEEVGIVFEQTGLPRMAGRVLGWLSSPTHHINPRTSWPKFSWPAKAQSVPRRGSSFRLVCLIDSAYRVCGTTTSASDPMLGDT